MTFARGQVLKRYVVLMAAATAVILSAGAVVRQYALEPPGDFEVRQGDILLGDGKYEEAIGRFAAALEKTPNHRGALMGRGVALLQLKKYPEAKAAFTATIDFLKKNLQPGDPTGRAVLAAAYANRGILNDRIGRHEDALADYVSALKTDEQVTEGPGVLDKIIYGAPRPATVRQRAAYLRRQLALPEDQRLLRVPELDAKQRMYKP